MWHGVKFLPCRNAGALFSAKGEYSTSIYHAHEWAIPNKGDASKVLKILLERNYNNVVSFDAYKDQPIGNVHGQLLVERIYTWTQFKIWPKIKKSYEDEDSNKRWKSDRGWSRTSGCCFSQWIG